MKRFLPFLLVLLAGCNLPEVNVPDLPDIPDDPVIVDPPPVIVDPPAPADPVVPSSLVALGTFARPVIDGSRVAAEGPKMASLYLWALAGGKWQGGEVVKGSAATAMRTYVPRLLGDYLSFRYGKKEAGKLHGPGLCYNGKTTYSGLTTGGARMAMSKDGPVLMSKNTEWALLKVGKPAYRSTFSKGMATGEKFDLAIQGDLWAVAHNGYSGQASALAIGKDGKATVRVTWADHKAYPSQGDDLNYPAVLIHSGAVWVASVYAGKLYANCWTGKALRWPATALYDLGPAQMQDRCPPALVSHKGRVVAVYVRDGSVVRQDVETRKVVTVCRGSMPAAQVQDGKIAIAYLDGGVRIASID